MDAAPTGPQQHLRFDSEEKIGRISVHFSLSADRDVNTAVNHTTNLLRRVFRASIRLHDGLTTSTILNAVAYA